MKVREIMTSDVSYCTATASLSEAATIMWQRDCGVVPIVDENKIVVGMLTDRDICIAAAMKNRLTSEIKIGEVISGKIRACAPGDDLEKVLQLMRKRQLRRLPVTDAGGVLLGIISISDVIRYAGKGDKVFRKKTFAALREISTFRPVYLREIDTEPDAPETSGACADDTGQTVI